MATKQSKGKTYQNKKHTKYKTQQNRKHNQTQHIANPKPKMKYNKTQNRIMLNKSQNTKRCHKMTEGEVGVWNGPKKDDVIYEQPLKPS